MDFTTFLEYFKNTYKNVLSKPDTFYNEVVAGVSVHLVRARTGIDHIIRPSCCGQG